MEAAALAGTLTGAAPEEVSSPSRAPESHGRRRKRLHNRCLIALPVALLVAQFVTLLALSLEQWQRFALTRDFAGYTQAWWAIRQGHLYPQSSLFGGRFLANDLELVMWPLAALGWLFPTPVMLLVVQDLAIVAAGALAFQWVTAILRGEPHLSSRARTTIGALALLGVVADPWAYGSALFGFEASILAAPFALLAARALWAGRLRQAALWAACLVMCGDVGILCAVGLGLSGLLGGSRQRRLGLVVAAGGLGLLAVAASLGLIGEDGLALSASYRYLDPVPHPGLLGVALGVIIHSGAVAHLAWSRLPTALGFLLPVGLVGVVDRRALGPVLVVLVPPMLASDSSYFRSAQAFQVWPALPLVLVGSAALLARRWGAFSERHGQGALARALRPWLARRAAVLATGASAVSAITLSAAVLAGAQASWINVPRASAKGLSALQSEIPPKAELVSSQGIVGRFGERRLLYAVMQSPARFPVLSSAVVFLFAPRLGIQQLPAPVTERMACEAEDDLGARLLVKGEGFEAFVWHPPAGTRSVTLGAARATCRQEP